jgi:hypothetical protein
MKPHAQAGLEVHRQVAATPAKLILGGVLLPGVTTAEANGERPHEPP